MYFIAPPFVQPMNDKRTPIVKHHERSVIVSIFIFHYSQPLPLFRTHKIIQRTMNAENLFVQRYVCLNRRRFIPPAVSRHIFDGRIRSGPNCDFSALSTVTFFPFQIFIYNIPPLRVTINIDNGSTRPWQRRIFSVLPLKYYFLGILRGRPRLPNGRCIKTRLLHYENNFISECVWKTKQKKNQSFRNITGHLKMLVVFSKRGLFVRSCKT